MADDDFFVGSEDTGGEGGDSNLDEFFQPSGGGQGAPVNPPDLGGGSALPVDPSAPPSEVDINVQPFAEEPAGGEMDGFAVPEAVDDDGGGKKKLILLIVAAVAGLGVLGGGGFFAYTTFLAGDDPPPVAKRTTPPPAKKKAPPPPKEKPAAADEASVKDEAPVKKDEDGPAAKKKERPATEKKTAAKTSPPPKKKAASRTRVAVRRPPRGTYAAQVGAYAVRVNVEEPAEKLARSGFDPYIVERKKRLTLYEVLVGDTKDQDRGRKIASGLKKMGYDPVIKKSGGSFTVVAVTHADRSLADKSVQRITKRKFPNVRVSPRGGMQTLNQLRVGEFRSRSEADQVVRRIRSKTGMAAVSVRN